MSNAFVHRYGTVYEHSPWVAERVAAVIGDDVPDVETLAQLMRACVDNASEEERLALIRAHPDLAGKVQLADELTADSASEQQSAGLDRCSADEHAEFQALNKAYHDKFGFPFVMAVRGSDRRQILAAFKERLLNDYRAEFDMALTQIHRIARLRLDSMGSDNE